MKRIDLTRVQPKFIEIVTAYMRKNGLNQGEIAELTGINRPRVNALINSSAPLSAYYLLKFIREGIIKVVDIKPSKSELKLESKRVQGFWNTAGEAENTALLRKIARARELGIDFEPILDRILAEIPGTKRRN